MAIELDNRESLDRFVELRLELERRAIHNGVGAACEDLLRLVVNLEARVKELEENNVGKR